VLTGTPIRTDGAQSVWLAYDDAGAIDQPEAGTYTLTYGEAVDLGYCRPVTFHRHEGKFTIDLENGNEVHVSGTVPVQLTPELKRIPGLQRVLNFYRLACTPQYQSDGRTPLLDGYQATMVDWASTKLTELRHRMPDAGGLVIAPSIQMAEYMATLIELVEGERPMMVHSQMPNAESKIKAFRNTDKRWIVSVAMISEGVDIRRLRVLIYLPTALTELAFRQAIGRVVRTAGASDDMLMARAHRYAIDYIEQAPVIVLAAARGNAHVPSSERALIQEQLSNMCDSGAQLRDVMRAYGLPFAAAVNDTKATEPAAGRALSADREA
jgi:hypothetical protein